MNAARRAGGILLVSFVVLAGAGAVARAEESPEAREERIAAEVAELQASIDEVSAEEESIQADLEATQEARAELDARLADLDGRIEAERRALAAATSARDTAIAGQLRAQDRLRVARRDLASSKALVREQAITAYVRMGSPTGELDVYLATDGPQQVNGVRVLMSAVTEVQEEEVERMQGLRDEHTALEREAEQARLLADRHAAEVETRAESVERLREELAEARAEVGAREAQEVRLLAGVQNRKSDFERRVDELRQESDAISEWLRASQVDQVPAAAGAGSFGSPLVNARTTSGFGYRVHPIFRTRRLHAGIDFGATQGTPILAVADGTVASAGVRGGYGNTVVIDHGGAVATLYAHQSRIATTAGAKVVRGQVIGFVGSTGNSTGPHLHFEVRVNGTPVDPRNYL